MHLSVIMMVLVTSAAIAAPAGVLESAPDMERDIDGDGGNSTLVARARAHGGVSL